MKIDILGTSFTVQSDQDPAYLRDVSNFYSTKVEEIRRSVTTTDPLKISILAGLLIIDEYYKYKSGTGNIDIKDTLEADKITKDLIHTLDQALERVRESDNV